MMAEQALKDSIPWRYPSKHNWDEREEIIRVRTLIKLHGERVAAVSYDVETQKTMLRLGEYKIYTSLSGTKLYDILEGTNEKRS